MGTEILNPQDCFTERIRIIGGSDLRPRWRSQSNFSNPKSHRRAAVRTDPPRKRGAQSGSPKNNNSNNNLALGQVAILKRGESLDLKRKTENLAKKTVSSSSELSGSGLLGTVPKQILVADHRRSAAQSGDEYAGAAFYLSPSPRALPLPSFSKKKQSTESVVDDSATKDLRRLLRLD